MKRITKFNNEVRRMFYGLRKFGRFVMRLFKWIPVLWRQEDWDYEYMYDLMQIKMEELLECVKKDDIHLNSDRTARQISICLEYFKRMRNPEGYVYIPTEQVTFEKSDCDNLTQMKTTKYFSRQCKKCNSFEKFNYDMFWKRFVQWHRKWWV